MLYFLIYFLWSVELWLVVSRSAEVNSRDWYQSSVQFVNKWCGHVGRNMISQYLCPIITSQWVRQCITSVLISGMSWWWERRQRYTEMCLFLLMVWTWEHWSIKVHQPKTIAKPGSINSMHIVKWRLLRPLMVMGPFPLVSSNEVKNTMTQSYLFL